MNQEKPKAFTEVFLRIECYEGEKRSLTHSRSYKATSKVIPDLKDLKSDKVLSPKLLRKLADLIEEEENQKHFLKTKKEIAIDNYFNKKPTILVAGIPNENN